MNNAMVRITLETAVLIVLAGASTLRAQEATILDRPVQVHGFVSEGFVATNQNNWLSMKTSDGSFAMTDFGVNVSAQITPKFRVGAQLYDRNIGELGRWHPELDWAVADYHFADSIGVRAGKVKTTLGLHTDTQDLNFVHPWAILPQGIYSLDLRASTIAHTGGDIYGRKRFPKRWGVVAFTAYAGRRSQDPYGGYVLGLAAIGLKMKSYGGWMHGEDVRWTTPIKGLLVGGSLMNQHITGNGMLDLTTAVDPFLTPFHLPDASLEREHSLKNDYYQYYAQYSRGRLQLESEYRREYRLEAVGYYTPAGETLVTFNVPLDQRSGYGSVVYRVAKQLEVGTYFSWYFANYSGDLSDPANHVYDGDITAHYSLNQHWDLKLEGHLIDGYGRFDSIRGFYEQINPAGLKPRTNGLVARTGFSF